MSRDDRTRPGKLPYVQIRNEHNEREYLHRFVYRQEHGEIPEGFVVHHKNEIKKDNGPGNLEAKPRNEHTPNAHYHWKGRDPITGEFYDGTPGGRIVEDENFDYPGKDGIPF